MSTERSEQAPECAAMQELLGIMRQLRDPRSGCPWDLAQDFASIAPYTIEEAYEVADAITRGDLADLCDELGDLLLQVVFHAQMASEQGAFDFAAVARAIGAKMRRRHPHVFAGDGQNISVADVHRNWEQIKAGEKSDRGKPGGVLADVPLALPALSRARKLGKRAAGVGFDWPDATGAAAKVDEELAEFRAAPASDAAARQEEFGDVLFSLVNLARHEGIDPEAALRAANAKFERRFGHVERDPRIAPVLAAGEKPLGKSLEAAWEDAKAAGL